MRVSSYLYLLSIILAIPAPASAQEEVKYTPPRLRITTEKNAPTKGLKVNAVMQTGLGANLGLSSGDVIHSIQVGDSKDMIESPNDLSKCLMKIRDGTMNKERAVKVSLDVQGKNGKPRPISGTILRAEVPDRFDGGTLYYFRPTQKDDPRVGSKGSNSGKSPE